MNRVKLLLKLANAFRRAYVADEWNEDEHNREKNGQFAEKENSGESTASKSGLSEIPIEELPRRNERRQFEANGRKYTQIKLEREEYARVMSEVDTWMTKERIQKGIYWQYIRHHAYVIIIVNEATNDVVIVGREKIP